MPSASALAAGAGASSSFPFLMKKLSDSLQKLIRFFFKKKKNNLDLSRHTTVFMYHLISENSVKEYVKFLNLP